MRRLVVFLSIAVFMGCTCIGQLQTQYLYVDESCKAQLPDYLQIVSMDDNCSEVSLAQDPPAHAYISVHTDVTITATDQAGNINASTFQVMLLDTIPPVLWFTDTVAYNTDQIHDVYMTFAGWVVMNEELFKEEFNWEELGLDPEDPSIKCYRNIICPDYFDWIIR